MTVLSSRNPRSLGAATLVLAGAVALGVAPAVTPGRTATAKSVVAEATLLDTQSWIMGGSGLPIPPPDYMAAISQRFIDPSAPKFDGQPVFPVDATNGLFTPEGLYPLTGVKTLPLDTSLAQGVSILDTTIKEQIAAGNNLVVLGYSQSATINSLEMANLMALPEAERPTAEQLAFVLLGDPSNPNGGLLSRFDLQSLGMSQLTLPSLGVTFSGATPSDTPWDTAIYTREYDGFADFPKYPINFLADLNAFMGIMTVHGKYPELTDEQMATAIQLATSEGYAGNTDYFMIPTETLPLLSPLLSIPGIGKPLYDLLEPDMRILINLGYGNIEHGWDQGPADVATPMGIFPTDLNWNDVFSALGTGAKDGWDAFVADLSHMSSASTADLSAAVGAAMPSLTDVINAFTSAFSHAYATLLPTADILNAMLTTLPAYNLEMFFHELSSGNILEAFGLPLSADVGLVTMAGGFEMMVMMGAMDQIQQDFAGLFG